MGAKESVIVSEISEVEMHARVVLGVGKGVLFRARRPQFKSVLIRKLNRQLYICTYSTHPVTYCIPRYYSVSVFAVLNEQRWLGLASSLKYEILELSQAPGCLAHTVIRAAYNCVCVSVCECVYGRPSQLGSRNCELLGTQVLARARGLCNNHTLLTLCVFV